MKLMMELIRMIIYPRVDIFKTLNMDHESFENLFCLRVFNGLYNERKPISWALSYIYYNAAFADELKEHPFSDTMPAKLMSLYLEGNVHFLQEEALAGYSLSMETEIFEVGSGPYFNDRYTVFNS